MASGLSVYRLDRENETDLINNGYTSRKKGEGKDNKRGTSGVKGNNFFAETSLKLFSEEKKQ